MIILINIFTNSYPHKNEAFFQSDVVFYEDISLFGIMVEQFLVRVIHYVTALLRGYHKVIGGVPSVPIIQLISMKFNYECWFIVTLWNGVCPRHGVFVLLSAFIYPAQSSMYCCCWLNHYQHYCHHLLAMTRGGGYCGAGPREYNLILPHPAKRTRVRRKPSFVFAVLIQFLNSIHFSRGGAFSG